MYTIKSGSRVSIAASCFSIYAYEELREQLSKIDELRFIFTSPSFITEKADKQRREFYIPRLNRERDLFGSEFEIKLRNELSLKAVAKECADWIRKKACFKSNRTNENMMGFINVDDVNYMPIMGFTTVDIWVLTPVCSAMPSRHLSRSRNRPTCFRSSTAIQARYSATKFVASIILN